MFKVLIALCVVALASGCMAGGYRPHTETEKVALAHAILGNALDAATTSAAVGSGDFREGNSVYSSRHMEENGGILAVKASMIAVGYIYGQMIPKHRMTTYRLLAIGGYGPAAYNAYLMTSN